MNNGLLQQLPQLVAMPYQLLGAPSPVAMPNELGIVRGGLTLHLDAGNPESYPLGGTRWIDLSNRRRTGTLINGPSFTPVAGGSLVFDGSNDYADIKAPSPLSGTRLFTFEIWVNFRSITGSFGGFNRAAYLFGGGSGTGGGQPEFFIRSPNNSSFTPSSIEFSRGGGGTTGTLNVDISSSIRNGNWYQIALTRNSLSGQNVYLNGRQIGTGNVSNNFSDGDTDFGAIGGQVSFSGFLNGSIACIRIYDRPLSAAEVQQNFNAIRGRFNI